MTNTLRMACCPQQQNVHAGSQLANKTFERKRSVCELFEKMVDEGEEIRIQILDLRIHEKY